MDKKVKKKLDSFFQNYPQFHYGRGDTLIRTNEPSANIFYLTRGCVRQYVASDRGNETMLNLFLPRSFFPMTQVFHPSSNGYHYEAMTNVTAHKAPQNDVMELLKKDPEILFDLTRRVFSGINGMFRRLETLLSADAYRRLLIVLLISGERMGVNNKHSKYTKLNLTQKELASLAGLTRETVSREIGRLRKRHLVDYQSNTLIIPDLTSLEKEYFKSSLLMK